MHVFVQKGILHVAYRVASDIPSALFPLADAYEGHIPHRVGWNLPVSPSVRRTLSSLFPALPGLSSTVYLIVYPARDIQTKKHELLHARYAMDPVYRKEVLALWSSLSPTDQAKVLHVLRTLQYPEREALLLDEFQAYYYTEPPRFFGLPSTKGRK